MTVIEIAKLNNMPVYGMDELKDKIHMINEGVSEEEQHEILEYLRTTDFCDTDEYDYEEDILPEERLNNHGHWDEQSFLNYTYATDEDGEWINPYNTDF